MSPVSHGALIDVGDGTLIVPPPATPPPPPPSFDLPLPGGLDQIPGVFVTPSAPAPPPIQSELPLPGGLDQIPGVFTTPPDTPTGGGGTPGDGLGAGDPVEPDGLAWDDPEVDGGLDDYELEALEAEAESIDTGQPILFAATHPPPGTIIGTPYVGTHAKAFNVAGHSDNWQSENAVDIWLFPGTHVLAVEDGVISPGRWGYGLSANGGRFAGWRLHLVGKSGRVYYYTHCAALVVNQGQTVKRGQVVGHSGVANGVPHLHFAVNPPFDPTAFARATYDLHARTAVQTDPKTGGPPPDLTITPVQEIEDAWTDLMHAWGRTIESATTVAKDRARDITRSLK